MEQSLTESAIAVLVPALPGIFLSDRILSALRLSALPAGLLALYFFEAWHIGSLIGPFRGDPDYPYLFGGLSLLNFYTPGFVDHPGTPVQLVIAAIALLVWLARLPFHPFTPLTDDVIIHSQFYLACIGAVFTLGMAAAMVFFVRAFRAASGRAAKPWPPSKPAACAAWWSKRPCSDSARATCRRG